MTIQNKSLYRSRTNRMVAGVCGGLGQFFGIDPTLVRLFFVLGTVFGLGSLIIVYIILMVVVPEEPVGPEPIYPAAQEPVQTIDVEPTDSEPI